MIERFKGLLPHDDRVIDDDTSALSEDESCERELVKRLVGRTRVLQVARIFGQGCD